MEKGPPPLRIEPDTVRKRKDGRGRKGGVMLESEASGEASEDHRQSRDAKPSLYLSLLLRFFFFFSLSLSLMYIAQ